MTELRRTPLSEWHRGHGARMSAFAGWDMPIRYPEGVIAEHLRVRRQAGIFDVSHMGELEIRGPLARADVHRLVTNDVRALAPGRVLYSALCNERGGVLDDVLVYCLDDERLWIVCNAANRDKIRDWVASRLSAGTTLADRSDSLALFAVQGPRSEEVLRAWPALADHRETLGALEYYHAAEIDVAGASLLLSRTGYTGEKGYELYLPAERAVDWWEQILAAGEAEGLGPVGLGARDTLRLEAGYSLYGHELDEETTPYEAGIGWVVKLRAGDFIGRDALVTQKENGVPRRTVALRLPGRSIPRQGAAVLADGREVGRVTSGSFSPVLEQGIGLARIESAAAELDLFVDVRGKAVEAERVRLPFVPTRVKD